MRRIALVAAWTAFLCLPALEAQANHRTWGRWWRCYTPATQTYQPYYSQQAAPAGPPAAPGQGVTQQSQSVEPDVVIPIEATRPAWTGERAPRSNSPGEAQQRRLRPGTPHRW